MKTKKPVPVYYIRTLVRRGTFAEDGGFMQDPGGPVLEVNSLLSVESADLKSWEQVLSLSGNALHEALNKPKPDQTPPSHPPDQL
jgi:hypothetical protein